MLDQPNRTRRSTKSAVVDPIFAAIKEHRSLVKDRQRADAILDARQISAQRIHRNRPSALVAWRNYSAICGYEIEKARDEFLKLPRADPEQIEKEYQDAKAREGPLNSKGRHGIYAPVSPSCGSNTRSPAAPRIRPRRDWLERSQRRRPEPPRLSRI